VYSNLDITKIKYDNNKLSIVQKPYVNAHMSPNILSVLKKNAVPKEFPDL